MTGTVFLITGTSVGFGNEYVKKVLAEGDIAVATSRDSSKLQFEGSNDKNFLAVDLDVTSPASCEKAFKAATDKFGHVDVVCNNAGYGLSGPFETVSDEQARTQMEVNFFGVMNVTRVALKHMREGKGGNIQQVTSIGGQRGVPSFSIYCASKWAIEGFTEAISQEVKPEWNIHLTCIEPGGFRTEWSGTSMTFGEGMPGVYDHIDPKKNAEKRNKTQAGDPAKGAAAMYKVGKMSDPPLRIVLGSDAFGAMEQKMKTYHETLEKNKPISLSTDVEEK